MKKKTLIYYIKNVKKPIFTAKMHFAWQKNTKSRANPATSPYAPLPQNAGYFARIPHIK